jgi:uncharacterized protein
MVADRAGAWVSRGALALSVASLLAYLSTNSALAVVLDPRRTGALLALAAVVAAIAALALGIVRRVSGGRLALRVAVSLLALVAAALYVKLLFLTHRAEEVRFHNGTVELAGTLYMPRGPGPFPAVVMVHGAGSGRRDEYAFYARWFAAHGIAGLAYDKRGTGASTGKRWEADYVDLSRDALAGLRFLQSRDRIDPRRVGVMGISEGEWVGLLAAVEAGDAAFLIVVSPSGRSPAEQVLYEVEGNLRRSGVAEEAIRQALDLNRRVFAFVRSGEGREALAADLEAARRQPWYGTAKLPDDLGGAGDWAWWRSVMDFDPLPYWSRLGCPVLALSGGRDPKNPAADAQKRIRGALLAGGHQRFTGRIYPRAEHGLIEWWLPGRLPPPRFARGYLDLLISWVREQTAPARPAPAGAGS